MMNQHMKRKHLVELMCFHLLFKCHVKVFFFLVHFRVLQCTTVATKMGDIDYEEAEQEENSQPEINDGEETGCFRKFQNLIIPPEFRDRYMQRANCCPPPIFIIAISIAEVGWDKNPQTGKFSGSFKC